VAKNYSYVDKYVILNETNLLKIIFKNFRTFFLTKYNHLFQFDGKSSSYFISYFINSNIKSTICFIKHKKLFNISYQVTRPTKFLLKFFYNNFIFCDEKYSNLENDKSSIHYQNNYFNILKKLNFKITTKKNLFYLDKNFKNTYDFFFNDIIKSKFYLFHFDEKWDEYKLLDYKNCMKIIEKISKNNKLIITTGIKKFFLLNDLEKKFNTYNFIKNKIILENNTNNGIIVLKNLPLNLLAYFISNSEVNISSHSGPVVHISPCFDKKIIDIIPKMKNAELDRWIPTVSKYIRINFEDLNEKFINSFIF